MKFIYIFVLISLLAVALYSYHTINYNNDQQALIEDAVNSTKDSAILAVKETAEAVKSATQAIDVSVDLNDSTVKKVVENKTTDEVIASNKNTKPPSPDTIIETVPLVENDSNGLLSRHVDELFNTDKVVNTPLIDQTVQLATQKPTLTDVTVFQSSDDVNSINNRYAVNSSLLGTTPQITIKNDRDNNNPVNDTIEIGVIDDDVSNSVGIRAKENNFGEEIKVKEVVDLKINEDTSPVVNNELSVTRKSDVE